MNIIHMKCSTTLLLLAIIFYNCSSVNSSCCTEKEQNVSDSINNNLSMSVRQIDMGHIADSYRSFGLYANFGFQFLRTNNTTYLSFLNSSKDKLIFIDIFSNFEREVNVSNIIRKEGRYCLTFIRDTIHLVNIRTFYYQMITVDSDFNLRQVYDVHLEKHVDFKDLYLNSNIAIDKKISFVYPYLLLPYGKFGKKNGMEKTACIMFNILNNKADKILPYPRKYSDCDIREIYPILEASDRDKIVAVFLKENTLSVIDPANGAIRYLNTIRFNSSYMCYDRDLGNNLAYTQKYDLNDEENENLIHNGEHWILLKRLRKNNNDDPVRTAAIVLDTNFNFLSIHYLEEIITTRLTFAYKKGFIGLDKSLQTGYYYEFSQKN